jgi:hypothetical protein
MRIPNESLQLRPVIRAPIPLSFDDAALSRVARTCHQLRKPPRGFFGNSTSLTLQTRSVQRRIPHLDPADNPSILITRRRNTHLSLPPLHPLVFGREHNRTPLLRFSLGESLAFRSISIAWWKRFPHTGKSRAREAKRAAT